jgi:hypothetical protein
MKLFERKAAPRDQNTANSGAGVILGSAYLRIDLISGSAPKTHFPRCNIVNGFLGLKKVESGNMLTSG